jgi:hypothetical protein
MTVEATYVGFTQAKSGLSGLFDELERGHGVALSSAASRRPLP